MNREAPQRPVQQSPTPKQSPGSRVWSVLGIMHSRGWLRPRRIGCLLVTLVVFMIMTMWLVGWAVNGITSSLGYGPQPVAGGPFPTAAPAGPASSGSATIDRILGRRKLIVAVQESPRLAQPSSDSCGYTGFDIALLDVIAHDLGVDPALTRCKPLKYIPASYRQKELATGQLDLIIGGYEIVAAQSRHENVAGPYLLLSNIKYVIGLPPGDVVLRDRITAVLRHAIDDGTWARLYRQYLGDPVPVPPVLR